MTHHDDTSFNDESDNGIYFGDPTPFQRVHPDDLIATRPLPIVGSGEDATEDVEDEELDDEDEFDDYEAEEYFFRRHWREPVLRIFPSPHLPKRHKITYLFGVIFAVMTIVVVMLGLSWSAVTLAVSWTLIFVLYPAICEMYRWRKRTVLIERRESGVRITYGEPDNIFFGFNGDGNGNVTVLEGSTEFNVRITWPNKLVFWGCGDLLIAGKVESGGSPLLENVPHIKQVRTFLNGGA